MGDNFPAAIAEGPHPFPSRTRQLSPPAPMILPGRPGGKVGRRREFSQRPHATECAWGLWRFGRRMFDRVASFVLQIHVELSGNNE